MDYNVTHIDLEEVFKKYLDYTSSDFKSESKNRRKTLCPFHKDTDPSMVIYDNTESKKGDGFFFTCLVCGAKGTAVDLLVKKGIAADSTKAEAKLRSDFNLYLPLEVRVEPFVQWKGLDLELCTKLGWKNNSVGFEIPYFDEDGQVIGKKIRVKYEGKDKYYWDNAYSGKDFHYGWQLLAQYDSTYIMFVEGETDFLTLLAAGFQVIGIPSVNAFLGDKYSHLYSRFTKKIVFRDYDAWGKKLVEDIGSFYPESTYELLLNIKQKDANDFFNFGCGRDLDKFKNRIDLDMLIPATVKTSEYWLRQNGEFIIENPKLIAKAFGLVKTPIERERLIDALKDGSGYARKLVVEQVKSSVSMHPAKGSQVTNSIYEDDNSYCKLKVLPSGMVAEQSISNFVLRPSHNIVTDDSGVVRVVRMVNREGDTSGKVRLTPGDLASVQAFNTRAMSAGNFNFSGDMSSLNELIQHIFDVKVPVIHTPQHIGHIGSGNWLFGNCGVTASGEIVLPDEEGTIRLDGILYLPNGFRGEDNQREGLPMMSVSDPVTMDIKKDLLELMVESYGTYGVLLGIGMLYSSIMANEIHNRYGLFPLTFITGKRNSGKTTYATQLHSLFGFSQGTGGASFASTTKAGMIRVMSYYKAMPVFFDDYRNNSVCAQKNPILLDAYNRQSRVRAGGSINGSSVQSDAVNSTAIISGEDRPSDSAIQSRCIMIELSGNEGKRSYEMLTNLEAVVKAIQPYTLELISRLADASEQEKFFSLVDYCASLVFENTDDPRQSKNMGIAMAGLLYAFDGALSKEMLDGLNAYVKTKATSDKDLIEESHIVSTFLNDVGLLVRNKDLVKDQDYAVRTHEGKTYFMFRFRQVYTKWVDIYGRATGIQDNLQNTLQLNITKEVFCTPNTRAYRFGGKQVRYTELCVSDMPDIYNDFKEDINDDSSEY